MRDSGCLGTATPAAANHDHSAGQAELENLISEQKRKLKSAQVNEL